MVDVDVAEMLQNVDEMLTKCCKKVAILQYLIESMLVVAMQQHCNF